MTGIQGIVYTFIQVITVEYIAEKKVEVRAPRRQGSCACVDKTFNSPLYAYALPSQTVIPLACYNARQPIIEVWSFFSSINGRYKSFFCFMCHVIIRYPKNGRDTLHRYILQRYFDICIKTTVTVRSYTTYFCSSVTDKHLPGRALY